MLALTDNRINHYPVKVTVSRTEFAEFERDLIRERTMAGLASARARGRKGGRKFALTKAQVRLAQATMAQRDTSVSDLCKELGMFSDLRSNSFLFAG